MGVLLLRGCQRTEGLGRGYFGGSLLRIGIARFYVPSAYAKQGASIYSVFIWMTKLQFARIA